MIKANCFYSKEGIESKDLVKFLNKATKSMNEPVYFDDPHGEYLIVVEDYGNYNLQHIEDKDFVASLVIIGKEIGMNHLDHEPGSSVDMEWIEDHYGLPGFTSVTVSKEGNWIVDDINGNMWLILA